jgi:predicted DNA-binding WGR domain protein
MQAAQQAEVLLKDMAMDPMPEPLWLHSRWERGGRYYELRVKQDLFGDWLLARVWGRKGSALGQIRHAVCADQAEAHCRYAEAEVRRVKRGYQLRCQPNS